MARWLVEQSASQLMHFHYRYARDDWDWFEPELAYDNARLPELLIRAGMAIEEPVIARGLETLRWLVRHRTSPRGTFRPVGCHGFCRPYAAPLAFDQQPIEAAAAIDAAAAFRPWGRMSGGWSPTMRSRVVLWR